MNCEINILLGFEIFSMCGINWCIQCIGTFTEVPKHLMSKVAQNQS